MDNIFCAIVPFEVVHYFVVLQSNLKGKNMNTKSLLVSLALALTTTVINADIEIDVISGATYINSNTIQMCIEDGYIHFEAIGESNNTDGELATWTVDDDTHAYGDTFYYVPRGITTAAYTIHLYDGMIINDTVDNQGSPLADEISVNVIHCN
jgi:hypothetical protein